TCMLDMIDANASYSSGSFVLYDSKGKGMEICKPSLVTITLDDAYDIPYIEKGITVTQQSAKKSSD
ncbi:MAG: hypothetical protein J6Q87_00090, partial [Clostridia bacterium]|nr:hypothetical protein [Clostridia bacterium]